MNGIPIVENSLMIDSKARRQLDHHIRTLMRDIPDYPKPGVVFKDITPILADAAAFAEVTRAMAAPFEDAHISHVVAVESRGFILGGPVAQQLRAGFVPVRKSGKLPFTSRRQEYELEYGSDVLEIHVDACDREGRVLIVDDVLATGGTADATRQLVESLGATVVGFSFLITLSFLQGLKRLSTARVESLLSY